MTHLDRRALLLAGAGTVATAALMTFEPAVAGQSKTKVFKGSFKGSDVPDWKYLPFEVPKGVREISVEYTYQPKDLGPISFNVVDIGIFDSSGNGLGNAAGFRGWSGGARRSFRISATSATPGYLAGPITPGRWRIALGPYQIDKTGTPYTVRVTLHYGKPGAKFVPNPAPTAVEGSGPGWYRGDLHVHTVHSDGSQTQAQALTAAQAAGLDFIGSSEHNTSSAQLTWGKYVPEGFLVIPGEEVTTRAGHWLAAGLPAGTWVDWRYRPEDDRLPRFTQQVRDAGGLAIAAHPYQVGGGITWGFGYDFDAMDAIEVWNGPWTPDDQQTVDRWHDLLVAGSFLPAVGNSDSHNTGQQIGLAQTVVRADSLSAEAVIAGYRAGRSWVAESSVPQLVELTAGVGDVVAEIGGHLDAAPEAEVAVRLEMTAVPGCLAQLRGTAKKTVLAFAVADDDGRLVLETTVPGTTPFVRVEVRRGVADDPTKPAIGLPMVALTNPVFVSPSAG